MRKIPPKNSTQRQVSCHPTETLNRHYRDLRRLIKHQIPPNNHQTQENKQGNLMYVSCLGKQSIYTYLAEGQPACMYVTVKPKSAYMFQKQGQAREKTEKIRPRVNRSCQAMIRQETKRNERNVMRKSTPNPKKEGQSPVWSPIMLRGKNSLWLG
jgi:hypothetical protein